MAEFEDSVFSNEEDAILLNMVRAYNIKNIKKLVQYLSPEEFNIYVQ